LITGGIAITGTAVLLIWATSGVSLASFVLNVLFGLLAVGMVLVFVGAFLVGFRRPN
jgi:hypothetical protein